MVLQLLNKWYKKEIEEKIMRYGIIILFIVGSVALMADNYSDAYSQSMKLEQQGQYRKAIDYLKYVYSSYRYDYELNLRLGWLYYLNKKHRTSVKYIRAAMRIKNNSIEAKTMILLPLTYLKKWSMLKRYARMVLKRSPSNYYALIRLAYAYYLQKNYKKSNLYYLRLYTFYPGDINTKLGLAMSYLAIGKKAHAAMYYKKVLKIYPNHQTALRGYNYAIGKKQTYLYSQKKDKVKTVWR